MGIEKEVIVIEDYIPLVKAIVSKYPNLGMSRDDLLQEGMIGLLEAKERFDESRNVTFATYATYWVKKRILVSIGKEAKESGNTVEFNDNIDSTDEAPLLSETEPDLPEQDGLEEKGILIPDDFPDDEKRVLELHFNNKSTLNEIAETMGISRERVRQLKQKALRRMRTLKDGGDADS